MPIFGPIVVANPKESPSDEQTFSWYKIHLAEEGGVIQSIEKAPADTSQSGRFPDKQKFKTLEPESWPDKLPVIHDLIQKQTGLDSTFLLQILKTDRHQLRRFRFRKTQGHQPLKVLEPDTYNSEQQVWGKPPYDTPINHQKFPTYNININSDFIYLIPGSSEQLATIRNSFDAQYMIYQQELAAAEAAAAAAKKDREIREHRTPMISFFSDGAVPVDENQDLVDFRLELTSNHYLVQLWEELKQRAFGFNYDQGYPFLNFEPENFETIKGLSSTTENLKGLSQAFKNTEIAQKYKKIKLSIEAINLIKKMLDNANETQLSNKLTYPSWNRTYSYILREMAFSTRERDAIDPNIIEDELELETRVFYDSYVGNKEKAQINLIRSLLVLEWLLNANQYIEKTRQSSATLIGLKEIEHYIATEIVSLCRHDHIMSTEFTAASPGYQTVCNLIRMVWLLPDDSSKKDELKDLCRVFKLHPNLIGMYPFPPQQKIELARQCIENSLQDLSDPKNIYKINICIRSLHIDPNEKFEIFTLIEFTSLLAKKINKHETSEIYNLLKIIWRLPSSAERNSLLESFKQLKLNPTVITTLDFIDHDTTESLKKRCIEDIQEIADLRKKDHNTEVEARIDFMTTDRQQNLISCLVNQIPKNESVIYDTLIKLWHSNIPFAVHQVNPGSVIAYEDSEFNKIFLKSYATLKFDSFDEQRFIVQGYCYKRLKLREKIQASEFGKAVMQQLASLEKNSHSRSPFAYGSAAKLQLLESEINKLFANFDPHTLSADEDVKTELVEACFNPQKDLYNAFNQHRFSWSGTANAPTGSILRISLAYVKAELEAVIPKSEGDKSITTLIEQIDALEKSSHSYLPWNYGSQRKLYSVLQAIITLKNDCRKKHQEFNKNTVINAIKTDQSIIRNALNQHRFFAGSTPAPELKRVINAIIEEEPKNKLS